MGKHSYAVVFDAGSSGTRVYVYKWDTAEHTRKKGHKDELVSLPEVKTKSSWNKKVKPGISTYGTKPEAVGHDHLAELVDFASKIVGKDNIESTPIFLLATAGMRLLPDDQRQAVLANTCSYFRDNTKFLLPECEMQVQVIPGETEGLYGWIAANYLLGGFDAPDKHDHTNDHHTYGFLDMGGASAQIAFAPNVTESEKHANDLKLLRLRRVDGTAQEYRVFVTTWLGFGANEARRRYVEHLMESWPNTHEVPDPCLPRGIAIHINGDIIEPGSKVQLEEPRLVGKGDFTQCVKATLPLLEKEKECTEVPCLLNGQHTPLIDFEVNHFVGVSEYWHTTHGVFAKANKDRAYDFKTYQKQVTDFCSRTWLDIEKDLAAEAWGHKVDEKTVEEVCFKASWLINMLHEGIGIPRVGIETSKHASGNNKTAALLDGAKDKGLFEAVDEIDGEEVSWTLGKAVLYASSQMPPATGALAVGFGSNVKGNKLPTDFQFPGGRLEALPNVSGSAHAKDWHDRILSGSYGRRVPGIFIFLLILFVCGLLICGRERRTAMYHKLLSLTGGKPGGSKSKLKKRPGVLVGKLFGNNSPTYERVIEEGGPDDFELADVSDDDRNSESSPVNTIRSGRTSGMVTPALRGMSPDFSRNSTRTKAYSYFDTPAATAANVASTPFERGGLMSRSESKERMTAAGSSSNRSRRTSPARRGSLISSVKENVE